jgi:Family of unknown function (DUF6498)
MERAMAAYRVGSSAAAAVLLVLGNLVPLAGVVWWGWDVWTILVLYWVENGVIGLLNIPKILLARGTSLPSGGFAQLSGMRVGLLGRGGIAAFFCVHYGIFWVVHGTFVLAFLPLFAGGFAPGTTDPFGSVGPAWGQVVAGAAGLAVSHIGSFAFNYVGRREYLRQSPMAQMAAPYGRVVVLHLAILAGGWLAISIGAGVGTLVVLVLAKTLVDLSFHLREHRQVDAEPATPAP